MNKFYLRKSAGNSRKFANITIIGLGREGKSLADFLYYRLGQKNITICDKNPKLETKNYSRYKFQLGKNYLNKLDEFDTIYLSPGISPHFKEIKNAARKSISISSATELFFNLCPAKIIGITGTKGKGTVAAILYQILKLALSPSKGKAKKRVFLLGNIGKPAIAELPRIKKNDLVVMELSSFQLQNLKTSPHLSIVLKITSDHLDYHKNLKEYFEAKTNILRWQTKKDIAVIHSGNKKINILKKLSGVKKIIFDEKSADSPLLKNIDFTKIKIPGKHNLENAIAAAIAAKILKIKDKNIQSAINNFRGRKHRLEFVKKIKGVKYYNDSAATNPDATIAAILSFKESKILIMGGQSKGNKYKELSKIIAESNIRKIILFGENKKEMATVLKYSLYHSKTRYQISQREICARARLRSQILPLAKSEPCPLSLRDGFLSDKANIYKNIIIFANNLKNTVKKAKKFSRKGDIVIFSPASASFDQFKNYEERGIAFKKEL